VTEQTAENKAEEGIDATPELPPNHAKPGPQRSRGGNWLLWLLLVVLAGAFGAFYWQQTQLALSQREQLQQVESNYQSLQLALEQTRSGVQSELQAQVELLESSASLLEQAMSELQQQEQQGARQLQELRQGVDRQLQDTRMVVGTLQRQLTSLQQRDTRWLNAEAAYLMRLANYKVTVEHDTQTAVQLLQTIERLLADQLDPAARSALGSVANDREALQNVNVPDKLNLSRQIDVLLQKLDTISIAAAREQIYQQGIETAQQQTSAVAQQQGWSAALIDLLRSIFVWRRSQPSELEFLAPDQETMIKQQIRLQFEQARMAVVQTNQQLFVQSLQQVEAGLTRHFVQESEAARELLAEVERLRAQQIEPQLPELSGSLVLIEQLQNPVPMMEAEPAESEVQVEPEQTAEPGQ
jgi:uroporphyrin-III C-methyltransferase